MLLILFQAISSAEVMTDRQCIHKKEHFHYATEDLISCCHDCGDGCDGGWPGQAMVYWKETGVLKNVYRKLVILIYAYFRNFAYYERMFLQ